MCVCVCVCEFVCVSVCVCLCVSETETETVRDRERNSDRQTRRQTDGETDVKDLSSRMILTPTGPRFLQEAYSVARQFNLIPPSAEQAEYHLFQREKVEIQMPEMYNKIGQ